MDRLRAVSHFLINLGVWWSDGPLYTSQFTSGLLRLEWILTVIQEIPYILLSKTRFMASQADRQSVKCAVGKLGCKTHNMHILSTYVAVVFKLKLIGLIAVIFSTAHYGCHFFTFFHLFHNRIVASPFNPQVGSSSWVHTGNDKEEDID